MDAHEEIVEAQAGFRKGHSTIDHITEKYLSRKGGKLYIAFIDHMGPWAFSVNHSDSLSLSTVQ